ncbi:MAG: Hpt domain-containing protein [Proteobacteria bacterium]|nr:Hpt domain-containing protein [Pseudomonadota bacterium]
MSMNAIGQQDEPLISRERPIDLVHLARQTMGDRALEAEILQLFVGQAASVLARLQAAQDARARADLAHTLKGSARAVGAFRLAAAAQSCENMVEQSGWSEALAGLEAATHEALAAIEGFRRAA